MCLLKDGFPVEYSPTTRRWRSFLCLPERARARMRESTEVLTVAEYRNFITRAPAAILSTVLDWFPREEIQWNPKQTTSLFQPWADPVKTGKMDKRDRNHELEPKYTAIQLDRDAKKVIIVRPKNAKFNLRLLYLPSLRDKMVRKGSPKSAKWA